MSFDYLLRCDSTILVLPGLHNNHANGMFMNTNLAFIK